MINFYHIRSVVLKIFFVWSILLPMVSYSQVSNNKIREDTLLRSINTKLNTYVSTHITERAYLQFDKPYYATGDTIYFKAYVTQDGKHELSQLSGVLYVDFISPSDKIVKSVRLSLFYGLAWGDFALPDSITIGNYRVRAYTNLMRNNGDDSFFDRTISIIGIQGKKVIDSSVLKKLVITGKPNIQFFPEGGNLVNVIKSKVAFKAVAASGMGIDVNGIVIDDENNQVAIFKSSHLGMGAFAFRPRSNKKYKAKVFFADGSETLVNLPMATKIGYALAIDTVIKDSVIVKISSKDTSQLKKPPLCLIAQSGGVICAAAMVNTESGEFTVQFLKQTFPFGIIQFTLFSANGEPLNERLFFNNDDRLKLNIETNKRIFTAREKVQIGMTVKNRQDVAMVGSFSVAVTDETKLPVDEPAESTIFTSLLLTSEIKGNIEQPNYYFINISDKARADLDILMLTQGYRHFEWKKVLVNNDPPAMYKVEKALKISGLVKIGEVPVQNGRIKLFGKSNGGVMLDTLSDANGHFSFNNLSFDDTTKFVIQARTSKGQTDVGIEIDKEKQEPLISGNVSDVAFGDNKNTVAYSQSAKQFYDEQAKYGINKHPQMLQEVVVKDKKTVTALEHSENLNGKGHADQVVTSKDFETLACGNIMDCLQSRLHGVKIQDGKIYSNETVSVTYDKDLKKGTFVPLVVIIDGTVTDYVSLQALSIDNVEAVEVLLGTHYGAIYGSRAASGAIVVSTKRAKKINNYYKEAPGVITFQANGFYKAREFYSPQYDDPKTNQKMADLRSTIYWNPNIITDKDGKASFSFFNADGKGTYRVVIEGIDADGNLGRQVYRYKVE